MAGEGAREWIELSDFSYGICGDSDPAIYSTPHPEAAPDGAARVLDTWGCYGHPRGGLRPMPKMVETFEETAAPFNSVATHFPGVEFFYITGAHIVSPTYPAGGDAFDYTRKCYDALFVAFHYYDDADSDDFPVAHTRVRTYKRAQDGSTQDPDGETIVSVDSVEFTALTSMTNIRFGVNAFDTSRTHRDGDSATTPGNVIVAIGGYGLSGSGLRAYPKFDHADDFNNDETYLIDASGMQWLVAHQGRIVSGSSLAGFFAASPNTEFGEDQIIPLQEYISYTDPNDITVFNDNVSLFVEENPSGYGAMASMNASELVFIKHYGGGVVIRGDVARPTVVRIPGIEPTRGCTNKGVVTPLGFIYGSRSGVWVWSGGTESTLLSPQLNYWFWRSDAPLVIPSFALIPPDPDEIEPRAWGQSYGQFAYTHPWVLAPGNWVMDMRENGQGQRPWWRLCPTSTYDDGNNGVYPDFIYWCTSWDGKFYGFPEYITPELPILWQKFDPSQYRHNYSWRSHPIQRTRNRVLEFREIELVAQGRGEITVDLIAGNGSTIVSGTFTITENSVPIVGIKGTRVEGSDIQVRITAVGHDDNGDPSEDDPAPFVYKLRLGYHETNTIRSSQMVVT